jgi:DNA-binding winged helix-turn-helix (wHTH) protein/Tfp pilus assembly protein PilF
MPDGYAFGPFELDARGKRLLREREAVSISARHFDLLHALVANAGEVLSKDRLIEIAWRGVAVTDNSLEQAISSLRKMLASRPVDQYIRTEARRGYRFAAPVTRVATRETDAALDALLAPHRAWIEGRAALETLAHDGILRARAVFENVLTEVPHQASAHVGLANACALQFETTRCDPSPDASSLAAAQYHATEACRLDPQYGEAWATLGFVLDRTGRHADALAASRRAVALEPDNWRHHLRLSYASWGEERLREARRTLALLPGFPLAHWLAASVYVARQALSEAERELRTGLAAQVEANAGARFSAVALHWLLGLIRAAQGDERDALQQFGRELAEERSGHLYARECAANTWYAIGAIRLRRGDTKGARTAFERAIARVPQHPLSQLGLAAATGTLPRLAIDRGDTPSGQMKPTVDAALLRAVRCVLAGVAADAASIVNDALASAPPGSAGWLLPVEPILRAVADTDIWGPALSRLTHRAA